MFDQGWESIEQDVIPYRPTSWSTVQREESPSHSEGQGRVSPFHGGAGLLEKLKALTGKWDFHGLSSPVGAIRKQLAQREDYLVFAVVFLALCDCDDDTEFLIALAIVFAPTILKLVA